MDIWDEREVKFIYWIGIACGGILGSIFQDTIFIIPFVLLGIVAFFKLYRHWTNEKTKQK
jgi:hypothetical protein